MTAGELIYKARTGKEMTQHDLARVAGVTESAICQYEKGDRVPRLASLIKILDALEIPIGDAIALLKEDQDK